MRALLFNISCIFKYFSIKRNATQLFLSQRAFVDLRKIAPSKNTLSTPNLRFKTKNYRRVLSFGVNNFASLK